MAEATTDMVEVGNDANAVATTDQTGVVSRIRRFANEPGVKRAFPAIVSVFLVSVGLIVYLILQQPSRTTLYASLPESEKARVVDALMNAGVDVTLDPTTGDVLVPSNDYHQARMSLAAQGLPQSVPDGYSALADIPMGSSRSVENIRLKQSQEIELARSIGEIEGVIAARVHLASPEKSVFARSSTPPTASVFVQMNTGRSLSHQQVNAIIHLVSSSVPNMAKTDVTVVDQHGSLLSKPLDDPSSLLSDNQLEHRMKLESIYRSRILSLVSPIVGAGNVTAQVNLDIDYTRSQVTEELVDPKGSALRSEQRSSDMAMDPQARGIPGTTSNQAPGQADLEEGLTQQQEQPKNEMRSSNEVRNYEVSRTVSRTEKPNNQIIRINAAVLVRENEEFNPETGVVEAVPFSDEQIKEIEFLVADGIGIDADRGDSLTVRSSAFAEAILGVEKPWWEIEFFDTLIKQTITLLVMGVVVLGVVRPLIGRIMVPIATGKPGEAMVNLEEDMDMDQVEINEGESLEEIKAKLKPKKAAISSEMLDTANTYDDKVAIIRMIVSDEAGRVSNVFKTMMQNEMD
ncbi:MAG: Flagellar M-ring protein [SAR116 cluster bacterium MED-G04]|jgi:flagellar M-ring protein FliF|nr:MAG: Flagellar M-ring protein [SAR116 cluster bacterium MED-G04]HCD49500.1 flagellar M-ring protein FliF [Alphaproteobacteria bacterium]|tara:strand:- start:1000 stop:2718 length:1719 start_codon:yes stop_codon:yes gene_type:complete